jgi:hypothetical protein
MAPQQLKAEMQLKLQLDEATYDVSPLIFVHLSKEKTTYELTTDSHIIKRA